MVRKDRGFTIIEMLLAMTFLTILLLSITLLVMQILRTYDKGTTLRTVEQAGVAIADELRRTINQTDKNMKHHFTTNGGRLCTTNKSYVWNYGKTILGTDASHPTNNKYSSGTNVRDLRFVIVNDGSLCDNPSQPIDRSKAREFLQDANRGIVLHDVQLIDVDDKLKTITMIVGTNSGEEELISGNPGCSTANGGNEFCAVNSFEFTVRQGEEGGS